MLTSLLAATGLQARALKTSLRLALLPCAIAIAASPAFAQVSESRTPTLPVSNGLPQVRETTGKWSLPESPPPNIIVLPGVSQADIDRVIAPPRPALNTSATQPSTATASSQPVPALDRNFQYRYVRTIPIYQGSSYQIPLSATTCSYNPGSIFSYQPFSGLGNQNFPLQGYGDNTLIVSERTVIERTVVVNNPGLDQNQVIVSRTHYPERLGRSNSITRFGRSANRFDRLAECGTIERY